MSGRHPWSPSRAGKMSALLIAGTLLVAMNLRPALTSVGSVLSDIRLGLGLPGAAASLLTGLPVLCFGFLAPLAPALSRRFGIERTMGGVLVAIAFGLLVRVAAGTWLLILGTFVAGGAIAVANVLLPVVVKRDFADRPGLVTGLYTAGMGIGASAGAAATVPIAAAMGLGWRGGLAFWAIPVVVALLVWLPQMHVRTRALAAAHPGAISVLLRDALAWQVTIFLGLQSLGFYALVAWLPSVYRDLGATPTEAGLLLSVSALVGVGAALTIPARLARARDQRFAAFALSAITALGLSGVLLAPLLAPLLWVAIIGGSQGAAFPLALTMIVLRTRTPEETQRLSAMSQSIGYLIAAGGPLIVGALHDLTATWQAGLALLVGLAILQGFVGLGAGRARLVGVAHEEPPPATA